jgi:hypothetical protein
VAFRRSAIAACRSVVRETETLASPRRSSAGLTALSTALSASASSPFAPVRESSLPSTVATASWIFFASPAIAGLVKRSVSPSM